jgi:hypothetical protein
MENLMPTAPRKDKYKLTNWKAYNQSLCKRGQISLWVDDSLLRQWKEIKPEEKVVGEKTYPDPVILCCLILDMQYAQPLRQTTGFVGSLLRLMGFGTYAVPDYSTLCRRQSALPVEVSKRWQGGEKLDLALDSTGLKVYGEGEWKVRKHGASKHRTWRKLHIGIDVQTQEIVSVVLSGNDASDGEVGREIVKGKKIRRFLGDGGYDDLGLREALGAEVEQIIPPPKNAIIRKGTHKKPLPAFLHQRNAAVEAIEKQKEWKIEKVYHKRSLNEVAMFRYKTTFTDRMRGRKIENQTKEVEVKCRILYCKRSGL